jgi:LacI family transcriptional regulator
MSSRAYRKTTIRDVAAAASVSVTTVSHVVSGVPGYSEETVQRVRRAIQDLNYVPSYVARGLRQRATNTIGVCATDPYDGGSDDVGSFTRHLWRGILDEADRHQQSVLHFPKSVRDGNEPGPFLNGLLDGLIMTANPSDPRPTLVARAGLPVVAVCPGAHQPDGVGVVAANEESMMALGLQHLWDLGHRVIAHVAGPVKRIIVGSQQLALPDGIATWRMDAFIGWLTSRGAFDDRLVHPGTNWDEEDYKGVLTEWMSGPKPTAVFCANDRKAWALIRAAQELGLNVPGDLSVMGVDDDPPREGETMSLTSIRVPVRDMGRMAVETVLRIAAGEPPQNCRRVVPVTELEWRASTAPIELKSRSSATESKSTRRKRQ